MSHIRGQRHRHHDKYRQLAQQAHYRAAQTPAPRLPPPLPPVEGPPRPFDAVEAPLQTVDLIHFNDFHRQLEPAQEEDRGGAARLATVVKTLQREHPGSVTVNLGDVSYDDGPISGKTEFAPIPQLFKQIGVSLLELGNHEFQDPTNDYASLRDGLINRFDGQVLCANVSDPKVPGPIPGTKPYTIEKLAGMNVAFIGLVTRDMATKAHPHVAAGLDVAYLDKTLLDLVPRVRAQGADAVVVMAHESFHDCVDLAGKVPGIDLVLAAHDHKAVPQTVQVPNPEGRTTAVIEAGSHGEYVGHTRLVVDPRRKRVLRVEGHLIPVDRGVAPDPAVQAIVDAYERRAQS